VFDIVGTDALLAGRHTAAGRLSLTCEVLFEGSHTCNDEEKRFVAFGNERIAASAKVTLGFEEIQEFLAKVIERCPFHSFFFLFNYLIDFIYGGLVYSVQNALEYTYIE
jgi:hypothetical protein